ncbi:MAG: hypothetical protein ACI9LO_000844 [Planctomycetota bacterium]|jgi:hypothetical protein
MSEPLIKSIYQPAAVKDRLKKPGDDRRQKQQKNKQNEKKPDPKRIIDTYV